MCHKLSHHTHSSLLQWHWLRIQVHYQHSNLVKLSSGFIGGQVEAWSRQMACSRAVGEGDGEQVQVIVTGSRAFMWCGPGHVLSTSSLNCRRGRTLLDIQALGTAWMSPLSLE